MADNINMTVIHGDYNLIQIINDNEFVETNQFIGMEKPKEKNHVISRTLQQLRDYLNNSNEKYLLLSIMMICILVLVCLVTISSLSSIPKSLNTIKTGLVWYQNEIIYEINVPMFRDSNQDGIGDLQGILEKLDYFEKNNIQSILLQSSIFNVSDELYELWDRQYAKNKITDLFNLDPQIGNEKDFHDFTEALTKKNMHLIIDLPLSSTSDHRNLSWYGSTLSPSTKIENPCHRNKNDLGCNYYKISKQLPLDFSNKEIADIAESRLRYWLQKKNIDGIRVDLPLMFDHLSNTYAVSSKTINQWKVLVKKIERKTKPKLLLFDIPSNLQNMINVQSLDEQTMYSTSLSQFIEKERLQKLNSSHSIDENDLLVQRFWQVGSSREHFRLGMMHSLTQRIFFTVGMLIGGTSVILYGDELGIKQKYDPWMPWTSDAPYGGFSSCLSVQCNEILSSYDVDFLQTNVENQEANVDIDHESLLMFFRRLSQLRKYPSFQNGALKKGYESTTDILWFIREESGHRGFIIVIHFDRFKKEAFHISLRNLTHHQIPKQIYYEYQSIEQKHLSSIDSDELLIYPGSINIFWWSPTIA